MTRQQREQLAAHAPYTLREDGVIIDCNGIALASTRFGNGEECDWDRALLAALNTFGDVS